MPSKEIYEQLGRMTLAYAALQNALEHCYQIHHPEGRDEARKEIHKENWTVHALAERVRGRVKELSRELKINKEPETKNYLAVLDRITKLSKERNLLVHGAISTIPELKMHYMNHKDRSVELTAEHAKKLNQSISHCWGDCHEVSLVFWKLCQRVKGAPR